jgi:uncharacterized repeat protein (TIGR03843 family)
MKGINLRRQASDQASNGRDDNCIVELLEDGVLALDGLLPWGSNYTFLGHVTHGTGEAPVVYKPVRGERPLWDFPHGTLAQREVAAFVVSDLTGWGFVPATVLRDGPHGLGAVQLFVEVDQDAHFFTFRDDPEYRHTLQAVAAFDIVVNNADRKGGHCLAAGNGRVWAIDHGVCFNAQPKLRTVIWDFAGQPLPHDLAADLCRLHDELANNGSATVHSLQALLTREELNALRARTRVLVDGGRFPTPPENRRPFPWPLV